MFRKLKKFLSGEQSLADNMNDSLAHDKLGQVTTFDLHIATAVLLVHIASADQEIAREEAEAVCTLIEKNLGIPEEDVPGLVEVAIEAKRNKGKIDEFVALINDKFNEEQRIKLLAMVWRVILADNKIEKFEDRTAVQIQNRLRLSPQHGDKARELAENNKI